MADLGWRLHWFGGKDQNWELSSLPHRYSLLLPTSQVQFDSHLTHTVLVQLNVYLTGTVCCSPPHKYNLLLTLHICTVNCLSHRKSLLLASQEQFVAHLTWTVCCSSHRNSLLLTSQVLFVAHLKGAVCCSPHRYRWLLTSQEQFVAHLTGIVCRSPHSYSLLLTSQVQFAAHFTGTVCCSPHSYL